MKVVHLVKRTIVISRPIFWPSTFIIFLFGIVMSGYRIDSLSLFYAFLWSFPYSLWISALNDLYDFETDAENSVKGGISGAKVSQNEKNLLIWLIGLSGIVIAISIIYIPFGTYIFVGSAALLIPYFYSAPPVRLKERPFIDSLSNGICIALVFMAGYFFYGMQTVNSLFYQTVSGIILGVSALHIIGAIRDIEPDRKVGMSTIATVLGEKKSSLVAAGLFFILFFVLSGFPFLLRSFPLVGALLSLFLYKNPTAHRSLAVGISLIIIFSLVAMFYLVL